MALLVPAFGGNQKIISMSPQVEKYGTWEWFSIFAIAIMGITASYLWFKAVKLVGPVIVGFILTSKIIFAYFIQTTLFGTVPDISSLIGSGCITIACIGILLEEKFLEMLHPRLQNIF